ncbi:MAG: chemotaxis protein CheX [SAR324 cluster bacterium]|nr:chemotaxis protein CheX [SAR324 cluster bacterium]
MISSGFTRSAGSLHALLETHIDLEVPRIELLTLGEVWRKLLASDSDTPASVSIRFGGPFSGTSTLMFPQETASKLVAILSDTGVDSEDPEMVRAGTLLEVGNIVLNSVMGSIGNILKTHFTFAVPDFMEDTAEKIMSIPGKETDLALVSWAKFHVKFNRIEGRIVLIFEQRLLPKLVAAIEGLE